MIVVVVGGQKPFDRCDPKRRLEVRSHIVDEAVRIRVDRRVRSVAAIDQQRMALVVLDDVRPGLGVSDFMNMLRHLPKPRPVVLVRPAMEQLVQPLEVLPQRSDRFRCRAKRLPMSRQQPVGLERLDPPQALELIHMTLEVHVAPLG